MKKFLFFAALMVASVSSAANYLGFGCDSVRINPNRLDGYSQHAVTMYNEAYCDSWAMSVTYPQGMMVKLVAGVTPLDGMSVPFIDRYGDEQLFTCPLNVSAAYATVSSEITVNGYWDLRGNGEYDPYGTVKWAPGAHSMFEYNFFISPDFRSGYVVFDGRITSGGDQRGPILQDVRFYKRTFFWVGYEAGDVSGNGIIDITDVTLIINYILGKPNNMNEFQVKAADVNLDGSVDVSDVGIIIMMSLS